MSRICQQNAPSFICCGSQQIESSTSSRISSVVTWSAHPRPICLPDSPQELVKRTSKPPLDDNGRFSSTWRVYSWGKGTVAIIIALCDIAARNLGSLRFWCAWHVYKDLVTLHTITSSYAKKTKRSTTYLFPYVYIYPTYTLYYLTIPLFYILSHTTIA